MTLNQKLFGDAHRDVAQSWGNLGGVLIFEGDLAGAERAYRKALTIDREVFPAGNDLIAWRLHDLGRVLTAETAPRRPSRCSGRHWPFAWRSWNQVTA